ncbi:MAG: hypothetical protein ABR981_02480 [Candidatus Micrarchaeaceae archaeon]
MIDEAEDKSNYPTEEAAPAPVEVSHSSVILTMFLTVLVVIAIIGGYYILTHQRSAIEQLFVLNRPIGITALANSMTEFANSTNEANISYSGSFNINEFGPTGATKIKIPLKVHYMKLGSDYKIEIEMQGNNSQIDNNLTFINIGNFKYSCVSTPLHSACTEGNSYTVAFAALDYVPFPLNYTFANTITSSVKLIKESTYENQSCTLVNGTINGNINLNQSQLLRMASSTSTNATYIAGYAVLANSLVSTLSQISTNGQFNTCISNQYLLPLNISAHNNFAFQLNSSNLTEQLQVYTTLMLNETGIGKPVIQSSITTLPAKIINSSQYGLFGVGNGINNLSFTSACIAERGYYCGKLGIASNGTMVLTIAQNTSINWRTANFVFVPQGTSEGNGGFPIISFTSNPANTTYATTGLQSNSPIMLHLVITNVTLPLHSGIEISGSLWAQYTTLYNGNNAQYAKMATISLQAK